MSAVDDPIRILILGHYANDAQESMRRYAAMLERAFLEIGWEVEFHAPAARFGKLRPSANGLGKWLGYLDKYLLFPGSLCGRLAALKREGRRFVLCVPDHSHGPYLKRFHPFPHVLHCHDLLAIRTGRGEFPGLRLGATGRLYQRWIASGLRRARRVTCVSAATASDFRRLFGTPSQGISVLPNWLSFPYSPLGKGEGGAPLEKLLRTYGVPRRYWIHVGGDAWYKNRLGALRVFAKASIQDGCEDLGLLMVGKPPGREILDEAGKLGSRVIFADRVDDEALRLLYGGAEALVFPSREEGFGWPILEAMACGTPVATTAKPPMSEVAGDAGILLPELRPGESDPENWAEACAGILLRALATEDGRQDWSRRSLLRAATFADGHQVEELKNLYEEAAREVNG